LHADSSAQGLRRLQPGHGHSILDEVLRRLPFRVQVVQTDNGAEFQSHFHWRLEALDIRHVYIRPRTPHLNGKVERSHRIDDQEFYQLLDKDGITDGIHLFNEKLRVWEAYYNYHRPGRTDALRAAHRQDETGNITGVLGTYPRKVGSPHWTISATGCSWAWRPAKENENRGLVRITARERRDRD